MGAQSMQTGIPRTPTSTSVSTLLPTLLPTLARRPSASGRVLPASSADLHRLPTLPPGPWPVLRRLGQECWQQATLGRPVLTGEMLVHLVTFGFFPRVLASFSPHAQGPIAGLGRELSQHKLWGKTEESKVMSHRAAGSVPWGHWLKGNKISAGG